MAKYAQGYERKNSDSKNLIILFSIIIAAVLLAVGLAVLANKLGWVKTSKTFSDYENSEYVLSDYDELLKRGSKKNYVIYCCSFDNGSSDTLRKDVCNYIEAYKKGNVNVELVLLNYDDFDSDSDTTEAANKESVEDALNYAVQSGYLIAVMDGKVENVSSQVLSDKDSIKSALSSLKSNKAWLEYNK